MKFDLIAQDGAMRNILGDNPVLGSANKKKNLHIIISIHFPSLF
jgi:hypothetical protein